MCYIGNLFGLLDLQRSMLDWRSGLGLIWPWVYVNCTLSLSLLSGLSLSLSLYIYAHIWRRGGYGMLYMKLIMV